MTVLPLSNPPCLSCRLSCRLNKKMLRAPLVLSKTRLDSLSDVKNLNLWGNELTDVSLLNKLPNLEIISLSINQLTTLAYFASCAQLQEIYLRKNMISDVAEVVHLQGLRRLHTLWLSDNPCSDVHTSEGLWYRSFVVRMLPQLKKLDNSIITAEERAEAMATNNPTLHAMHKRAQHLASQHGGRSGSGGSGSGSGSFASPTRARGRNDGGGGLTSASSPSSLRPFDVDGRSYIHMEGRALNVAPSLVGESRQTESKYDVSEREQQRRVHERESERRERRRVEEEEQGRRRAVQAAATSSPRSRDVERMVNLRESQSNPLDFLGTKESGRLVRKKNVSGGGGSGSGGVGGGSGGERRERKEITAKESTMNELDSASALAVGLLLLERMNDTHIKEMMTQCTKKLR